ncbi:hypothetical protein GP486_002638 [Trichoglossum hirsutum]|uniref:Ubiquitin-like domain-containing protein n=1 Tax=Trichoglossum hirsutum TaxID=265104 RepID=A0A9P8LEU5_9PEZI|nr:hypothetical protein GP486_002638 [Trichoglossum hirsutum]
MSSGFVSDFAAVSKLIADIVSSLRDAAGSASEYQELFRELDSLQLVLTHVDKLQPVDEQQLTINAIKCAALSCKHILSEFYSKAQKYEGSLGLGKSNGKLKDLNKKILWRLHKEEVRQLREKLNIHVGTVNMMLMAHGLEMLNTAAGQSKRYQSDIQKRLDDSCTSVEEIRTGTKTQETSIKDNKSMLTRLFGMIEGDMVPQLVYLTDTAKELLSQAFEINRIVLKLQTETPRPDLRFTWFQEPVKLEDALGRIIPVPSEYSYSTLEAIIKDRFKTGPGRLQVLNGEYEIFNTKDSKQLISDTEGASLLPGMSITMAIIIEQHPSKSKCCPNPQCSSRAFVKEPGGGNICSQCRVRFGQAIRKLKRVMEITQEGENEPLPKRSKRQTIEGPAMEFEDFKNVRVAHNFPSPSHISSHNRNRRPSRYNERFDPWSESSKELGSNRLRRISPSQGDAVIVGFLGGYIPLFPESESEESTDADSLIDADMDMDQHDMDPQDWE